MTKYSILIAAALLLAGGTAFAQESITFPIAELGGCTSKQECKAYCDDINHIDACVSFGEAHGLMSTQDATRARAALLELRDSMERRVDMTTARPNIEAPHGPDEEAVLRLLKEKSGPGGCSTKEECREYCESGSHIDECMDFALANGLMTQAQVEQAKKFINKTGPGGCKGSACKTYCESEVHAAECIAFAEENGFISKEEAARAKTFINKPGPGGCTGEACKTYCEDASHMEECMQFAVENGFITEAEAERARNFKQSLTGTSGPGGCEGEACKTYCDDPAHRDACVQFAEEHGFAKPRMIGPPVEDGDSKYMGGEQSREGEPYYTSPNQATCDTPEECKDKYELRGPDGKPIEPGQNPQYEQQQYEQQRHQQISPEQQQQYQQQHPEQYQQQYYQQPPTGVGVPPYQGQMMEEQMMPPPPQYQQPPPQPTSSFQSLITPTTVLGAAVGLALKFLLGF